MSLKAQIARVLRVITLFWVRYLLRLSVRSPWNGGRLLICLTERMQPHNWWSHCNGVLIKRIYDLIYADLIYGCYIVLTRNYAFTCHYVMISIFRRIILFNVSLLRATAIYIENQGMRLNCRFVSQCIMIEFFPDGRMRSLSIKWKYVITDES